VVKKNRIVRKIFTIVGKKKRIVGKIFPVVGKKKRIVKMISTIVGKINSFLFSFPQAQKSPLGLIKCKFRVILPQNKRIRSI
jgi:hypothetical protein